jgi:hypothetical protein
LYHVINIANKQNEENIDEIKEKEYIRGSLLWMLIPEINYCSQKNKNIRLSSRE